MSFGKLLGRAHVLSSGHINDEPKSKPKLLILTPQLPKLKSDGDRALRAVCGTGIFDVVEMFSDEGEKRLQHYSETSPERPLPGFWSEEEIEKNFL